MAVCPICGCKTDELDFVARVMNKEECKVCSFCNRQLNVFETANEPTEAQLRWLNAVVDKEVPEREENVCVALKEFGSRFSGNEAEQSAVPMQPKINKVPQGSAKKISTDDNLIIELQNRITALENEIRTMKRKQMIKTIIELGAPFALLILLVIVFLSSGIMENFKAIFDMAGIAF
jgi:hypothetical protein